jgi:2-polyprenyl-6-methoxyphenol hydroxylase-like FAD-dependent oxidoreductase
LRVAVVGRSIGGLCAATALASAGCDVKVHERAPGLQPGYAGYVAWRRTLDEARASDGLAAFFDDRFTFCDGRSGGHVLCYLIPGDGAAVERGRRRLDWVWYVHVPEVEALGEVLTDRDGERHAGSVPAGRVPERLVARVQDAAARELHPRFAELVAATPGPLLQVILDLAVPRMLFGRACLLGDAAFVVRPHTAGATAKAAADARALAAAARSAPAGLGAALARWERERLAAGQALLRHGVSLGRRLVPARGPDRVTPCALPS